MNVNLLHIWAFEYLGITGSILRDLVLSGWEMPNQNHQVHANGINSVWTFIDCLNKSKMHFCVQIQDAFVCLIHSNFGLLLLCFFFYLTNDFYRWIRERFSCRNIFILLLIKVVLRYQGSIFLWTICIS